MYPVYLLALSAWTQPHLFPRRFNGPGDVIGYLRQTSGVSSIFRGTSATLLRDGSGSFAYFSVYEWIKRSLTPEGQSLSPIAVVLGTFLLFRVKRNDLIARNEFYAIAVYVAL
jgi:hypothetical protein